MPRKRLSGLGAGLLGLGCGLASGPAGAATTTTTFAVTANVLAICTVGATPMNRGDYAGLRSTINLQCTSGAHWAVGLDQGAAPGASVSMRPSTGLAPAAADYQAPVSAGAGGDGANGRSTVSGDGTGGEQAVSVFVPRAPAQKAGADTVTATISF